MLLLAGGDVVRPDAVAPAQTLVIENGVIVRIRPRSDADATRTDAAVHVVDGHSIVPGFIDVHVHGVAGIDTLGDGDTVGRMAAVLPRFGVTAFCPTTVACGPAGLRAVLGRIRRARECPAPDAARVLPAHLESNFISPQFRGAQPLACLRTCHPWPDAGGDRSAAGGRRDPDAPGEGAEDAAAFDGFDILREIDRASADVAVVTLAPEIEGAMTLVQWLRSRGIRVSLGHSGATLEEADAAILAGANQATHLFNGMPPMHHREPGLAGAVLRSPAVMAELVCDGVHVHPAMMQMAIAAKGPDRIMAITDGTAAAGLRDGDSAQLGGRPIRVRDGAARLDDGTMAGSVLTMDGAFRMLTGPVGCSFVEASHMCSTTPARALGLAGFGVVAEGARADLVVLDRAGVVARTYIDGRLVYARDAAAPGGPASASVEASRGRLSR